MLEALKNAAWIVLPFKMSDTVFSFTGGADTAMIIISIITIMPIAVATIIEHIGDISAISSRDTYAGGYNGRYIPHSLRYDFGGRC